MANHKNVPNNHLQIHCSGYNIQVMCSGCNSFWNEFVATGTTRATAMSGKSCPLCGVTKLVF